MRLGIQTIIDVSTFAEMKRKANPRSPEMMRWRKRAAVRYRAEQYTRFVLYSRGGGNWKPTKSRKTSRRTGRRKNGKFILRQTDTLLKSLTPVFKNLPGQLERLDGDTIVVAIGGSATHPTNSLITVGELAHIHHFGLGIQEAREILVQPSQQFRRATIKDLRDTFLK